MLVRELPEILADVRTTGYSQVIDEIGFKM